MTLPGLALFYAGLVQHKNVVSVLIQHFSVACLCSMLWVVVGYSIAFSGDCCFIGNFDNIFIKNVNLDRMSGSIPESVFLLHFK